MRLFRRQEQKIAILDVAGEITESLALNVLLTLRNTNWAKRNIRGVIVRVCSNGGSLGAAQAICEGVEALRMEAGLFTVSLVTDTALSAGFFVTLATDTIVVSPAATLGNVGAIIARINLSSLTERLGISYDAVKTGVGKGMLHPLARRDDNNDATTEHMINDIGNQFLDWIHVRRNVGRDEIDCLIDGRMLSGRQALAMNLVDSNGGLFTAIRVLSEKIDAGSAELVWLNPQSTSLASRIFKMLKGFFQA